MPVIQLEANLTAAQLLRAARQLPAAELSEFARAVNSLRPAPKTPRLSPRETELLLKINEALPADLRKKSDKLYRKWQRGAASELEYEELLKLNQQVEAANAKRIGYLAELAQLQQKPLRLLMKELGLKSPSDE